MIRFKKSKAAFLAGAFTSMLFWMGSGGAFAWSPVMTVLRHGNAPERSVRDMVQGFAACDTTTALSRPLLESHGVRFLAPGRPLKFAFGKLVTEPGVAVLDGNDPGNMESTSAGFLSYGGRYRLKGPLDLGGVRLVAVANAAYVTPPRGQVSITYTFDKAVPKALPVLEQHGALIAPSIGREADPKSGDVRMVVSEDGKSLTCLRYLR